jgi:hypothetical protein
LSPLANGRHPPAHHGAIVMALSAIFLALSLRRRR